MVDQVVVEVKEHQVVAVRELVMTHQHPLHKAMMEELLLLMVVRMEEQVAVVVLRQLELLELADNQELVEQVLQITSQDHPLQELVAVEVVEDPREQL
jgi:hypothetical protein